MRRWFEFFSTVAAVRLLIAGYILLAIGIVTGFYLIGRNADRNKTALRALCAQRVDLEQRILAEKGLLLINPGKAIFGIPRSLFVDALARDQTTRRNLEILDC